MKIIATFANRAYDPEEVELVCAWDEFSVDNNHEGWEADRRDSLASWGNDLLRHVTVEIDVEMGDIYEALDPRIKVRGHIDNIPAAAEGDNQ